MASLSDFRKNGNNTNKGTDRGREFLRKNIQTFGWAGAMVADKDGNYIDGNHRDDIAKEAGAEPIIVRSDGTRPIIHIREDIEAGSPEAVALATSINRSADLNHRYDYEAIGEAVEAVGLEPQEIGFTVEELTVGQPTEAPRPSPQAAGDDSAGAGPASVPASKKPVGESYQVMVQVDCEDEQRELYERLTGEGYSCRVLTL